MAESREPSTTHDMGHEIPTGGQRDRDIEGQRQAAEREAEKVTPAPEGVPRGPNTPENLEQIIDLSDIPTEPGIHMHPASLIAPDEALDLVEGDDEAMIP